VERRGPGVVQGARGGHVARARLLASLPGLQEEHLIPCLHTVALKALTPCSPESSSTGPRCRPRPRCGCGSRAACARPCSSVQRSYHQTGRSLTYVSVGQEHEQWVNQGGTFGHQQADHHHPFGHPAGEQTVELCTCSFTLALTCEVQRCRGWRPCHKEPNTRRRR